MQTKIDLTITSPEIANALITLATAISQIQPTSETQKRGEKMEMINKTKTEPTNKMKPQPHQSLPITLETLRTKLIDLSRNGKQPQIKALINSYGVNKLTDIPESKYEEMLAEVEKW